MDVVTLMVDDDEDNCVTLGPRLQTCLALKQ